ncbi:hypothetical protein TI39_contig4237g00003 [Zymoseptoria brevis]|uniref:Tetratricopeptide repeat protein 15 n=1 Tax=Zymoseptoria brevis TaxID=1047168 RepID=A0A0F4G9B7_9PEZI|nr:hypothetical protein TI39_contig4237g00003 [Zymoseptoria brevis]
MDSTRSPPGSVRRHGRNVSHAVPQRATRGPLEDATDDPLAVTSQSPPVAQGDLSSPVAPSVEMKTSTSADLPKARPTNSPRPPISLQFLQHRSIYQGIPADGIPNPFLASDNRPGPETELPVLLKGGHFRRAAERAVKDLLESPPNSAEAILQLLYVRLACLILISRPDLAAAEAGPLTDLFARNPPGAEDVIALVPWDLRLLLVRLQSIGAADGGRRGIMALYALAGEVRSKLRAARFHKDDAAISAWSARLQDLGLRVCDTLVEMGELETATRHLDTLSGMNEDELAYRKALLRVRVGDVNGAREYAIKIQDETKKRSFEALLKISIGDFSSALDAWQTLASEDPADELFAQNTAISLLYTGQILSARTMLEDLAQRLPTFPTLLFNLSTVYELCTERAVDRKTQLVHQSAAKEPSSDSGGWERSTFEFKL